MIGKEHRVVLAIAEDFGAQLKELAKKRHVWAVRSAENEVVTRWFWNQDRKDDSDPLDSGITLFEPQGATREDHCLSIIDEIDEHHGEYSHDPALNVVEVYGVSLTNRIRNGFAAIGFLRFEPSENGFVAYREARHRS